ncbi:MULTISPECIES: hypothetical protein [unclassified Bradyrhizobium]
MEHTYGKRFLVQANLLADTGRERDELRSLCEFNQAKVEMAIRALSALRRLAVVARDEEALELIEAVLPSTETEARE